jgi:hypothetical protein
LCGTDHFGKLGTYEERIIKLILEGGREKQIQLEKNLLPLQ